MLIKDSESPLFQESKIYKPFKYPYFEELRQEHENVHWRSAEAELSDDVADWRLNMTEDEKAFIKTHLTVFTTGDVIVAQNYKKQFIPVFQNNEANNWFTSVANRESEHQFAYAMANETFGLPDSLFGDFEKFHEMRNRVDVMATQYDAQTIEGIVLALAHTVLAEGVSLFGVFINLLNFHRNDVAGANGKKGRLKGFTKINKWSLRDESLHVDGAAYAHKQVLREHRHVLNDELKKQIYDIARRFVEAEDIYFDLAYKQYHIPTLPKEEAKAYIRFMADRRLIQLGYKPIFGVKTNPCPWVDEIMGTLSGKKMGNFFETRIDDYQVSGALIGEPEWGKKIFVMPSFLQQ